MSIDNLSRLLREHPFLRGLDETHIEFLTGCASNLRFDEGDLLARDGDVAARTLMVRRGRVALDIPGPPQQHRRLQTVGPGEIIGWSWLFPPYEWHFDARALEPTLVLAFDGACLRAKLEDDPTLGYAFLKRLVRAMHDRLERARMQLADVYGAPAVPDLRPSPGGEDDPEGEGAQP